MAWSCARVEKRRQGLLVLAGQEGWGSLTRMPALAGRGRGFFAPLERGAPGGADDLVALLLAVVLRFEALALAAPDL